MWTIVTKTGKGRGKLFLSHFWLAMVDSTWACGCLDHDSRSCLYHPWSVKQNSITKCFTIAPLGERPFVVNYELWLTDGHWFRCNSPNIFCYYHVYAPWRLRNFKLRFRVFFFVRWSSDMRMVVSPSVCGGIVWWRPNQPCSHSNPPYVLGTYSLVVSWERWFGRLNSTSLFLSSYISRHLASS